MNNLNDPGDDFDECWNWYLCLALLANAGFWLLLGLGFRWLLDSWPSTLFRQ